MLTAYPACFLVDKEGKYSVIFPDLNDLATCGDTLQEALEEAVDCLAGYIYEEKKEGHALPKPTPLQQVSLEKVAGELDVEPTGFVNIVAVDAEEYARIHFNKMVQKRVTIPAWLNDAAKNRKIDFSQILQRALVQQLGM